MLGNVVFQVDMLPLLTNSSEGDKDGCWVFSVQGAHGGGCQSCPAGGDGSWDWDGSSADGEEHGDVSLVSISESSWETSPGLLLLMLKGAGPESKPPCPPAISHGHDGVPYSMKWGHSQ